MGVEAHRGRAADAAEGEGRALARWIRTELVGTARIPDGRGGAREVRAGDVARGWVSVDSPMYM